MTARDPSVIVLVVGIISAVFVALLAHYHQPAGIPYLYQHPLILFFIYVFFASWYGDARTSLVALATTLVAAVPLIVLFQPDRVAVLLFLVFSNGQLLQVYTLRRARRSEQRAITALFLSEERLRTVIAHTPVALFAIAPDGTISLSAGAAKRPVGPISVEHIGQPIEVVCRTLPKFVSQVRQALHGESVTSIQEFGDRALEVHCQPQRDPHGSIIGMCGVAYDMTERLHAEQQLAQLAHHDWLTGLGNRALFNQRLAQVVTYAERTGSLLGVLFVDLDGFKMINDTCGHEVGDLVLRACAERLSRSVRRDDTVARLAGDEFTVLLPDLRHGAQAEAIAQTILAELTQPIAVETGEVYVTASIGIGLYPTDGDDAATLLKAADVAMYRAKTRGKNRCARYGDQLIEVAE